MSEIAPDGAVLSVTRRQLLRFVVVGLASNLAIYIIYLFLASAFFDPKIAMTITFAFGVLLSFSFNRRWTFDHRGPRGNSLLRYSAVYLVGYTINLSAIVVFVDRLGLPHEIVQGCMILIVAVIVFLLQKHWVFRTNSENKTSHVDEVTPDAGNP